MVFRDADPGDDFPRVLHGYTEGIPLQVVQVLHALADGETAFTWCDKDHQR